MTQVHKLTTVTRRDLAPGYQAVQASHSSIQFIFEHPEISKIWFKDPYLAHLSIENEVELEKLMAKLTKSNITYSVFREPDINNQITSITIEPSDKTRRMVSNLPLMLKEVNLFNQIKVKEVSYA